MNFKEIHIGQLIRKRVTEREAETAHICSYLNCTEDQLEQMYSAKSLDTDLLLKWSKILGYDFFRIYTQHLILYSPPSAEDAGVKKKTSLPVLRKNIYTREIISFVLEKIHTGVMTKKEVMEIYRIPKTTLYKWIAKYSTPDEK